ncbi:MAG: YfhO family protein [Verrucomicrobia subdivision 3 bacterium]|nr:YfhO family protein [Limisphaerales bacterium]
MGRHKGFLLFVICLAAVVALLFRASFHPDKVIFSNDAPLGIMSADFLSCPELFTGGWFDLNWLGFNGGAAAPSMSWFLAMILNPFYYSKFMAPLSVFFLGLCAWLFFNQLGFSRGASGLAAVAMALNSNFFSNVCWGLGSRANSAGMFFLAMAVLIPRHTTVLWIRIILSGFCIGIAVMEGGDNAVIFSFYLSAFVLFQAWQESGAVGLRLGRGVLRLVVLAMFAVMIATQGLISLYQAGVKNMAGTKAGSEVVRNAAEQWDWATQWSLPKTELLRVIIPGLFGYRMDSDGGANYWGAVGRTPGWEQTHAGIPRHSGAGEYAGVLVVLVAIWTIAQAARKDSSVFTPAERRWIWFWSIAALISILLAVGRYAPFYRIIYSIPYFSAIRNPMKFMHPCHIALVILFAYGLEGMVRRYLSAAKASATNPGLLKPAKAGNPSSGSGWAALPDFDRKWLVGVGVTVAVALFGWTVYSSSRQELEKHLVEMGFPDSTMAKQIAGFSIGEVGWFVLFLLLSAGAIFLVVKGSFAGRRANLAIGLLGLLLVMDLGRANAWWVIGVNYKHKYASNPVIDLLQDKPYEHRAAMSVPFNVPRELGQAQGLMHQIYGIEWMQHLFPYYNIQALEVTQLSRKPEEYVQFEDNTFGLTGDPQRLALQDRHWELTTTRYLIGLAAYAAGLEQIGSGKFKLHSRYDVAPKPGVPQPRVLEDLTVQAKPDGPIALFELTTALPRAKLYTQWQLSTNTPETLRKLADESFDPHGTVLLSEPLPAAQPPATTNAAPGTVEITGYVPKQMELRASATAPSILMTTDKHDPDWKVRVNGREEKLLRLNYTMRGVFLPAGQHNVVFSFEPTVKGLYVTTAGAALGVVLGAALLILSLRRRATASAS